MQSISIEALVDQMTLEEQVSLMSGEDFWSLPAIERLGIGKLRVTDGPNGARGGGSLIGGVSAAAFPVGIALGATWDPELAQEIGSALADEVKSKNAHVSLAPTVNIHRSVTNGRNFECYSEDPELTAALAVGYIKGLQNKGVSATIKHFAGNESEIQRTTMSSEVDERSLREIYLRPFEDAVKKAGTWGIMSSYNRLNGTYTSENPWLLTKVLREDWGYDGIVMSDWFGSHSTAETVNAGLELEMPGPARDRGDKLVAAVEAGEVSRDTIRTRVLNILRLMARTGALNDYRPFEERADNRPEHRALIRRAGAAGSVLLKNDGLLPLAAPTGDIAVIGPNAKVARVMGGGSAQLNPHYTVSPWEALSARFGEDKLRFAEGATNHRWQPLMPETFSVDYYANTSFNGPIVHQTTQDGGLGFLIPPLAEGKVAPDNFSLRAKTTYVASRSGLHHLGAHAAGYLRVFVDGKLVIDLSEGKWARGRTFFEEGCDEEIGAVELKAGQSYEITVELASKNAENLHLSAYYVGIGVPLTQDDIDEAARVAAASETALVFVGRSGEWDTEGSDLEGIALPGMQDALVEAVLKANPRTVVVLQTGGPVEMPWMADAPAILQAWYPGQEAGNAIADVLFGDVEPSGRLPQTFPTRWEDNPTRSQDPEIYPGLDGKVRYAEELNVGYRHYSRHQIKPMFAFGHGLGYTTFTLDGLVVVNDGDGARASVTLTNIGDRSGSTVAQLYVTDNEASVERPDAELKGWAKVTLAAGESRTVEIALPARAFAFYDVAQGLWQVEAGDFTIAAGLSAVDIRARATLTMAAQQISVRA